MPNFRFITRTVWVLSLVSLFTDMASEMLYPVLPFYLKSIGYSIAFIGILEGIAEACAGLSKGYFGKLSDYSGKRMPFVQLGYGISALSKPLMAAFVFPLWIFFARTLDRLGKGIRTGARDALLSDASSPETKGKVFGFHRAMDTLGAVLGPSLGLLYLYYHPEDYRTLFFIAFIPGLCAVLATFFTEEKHFSPAKDAQRPAFFSFLGYWKTSPLPYKKVMFGLLLFALFNSSDVFLLLKAKEAGLPDQETIAVYIFYNLVFALAAYPLGSLGDKIGLKRVYFLGLGLFALVYFGMAFATKRWEILALFFIYGVFAAATDGISKAWISNITDKKDTATAIGTFAGLQSLCAMLASAIAGLIWYHFNSSATFLVSGIAAVLVLLYFSLTPHLDPNLKQTQP